MKILVFAHRLEVGGTQVNAIELAAALRDSYGHEPVLFATPGPMVELAEAKGLRFLPAPDATRHPSSARMRALRAAVRSERPDLVHAWDWPQCLDAYYGVHLIRAVPLLVTVMSMVVPRLIPRGVLTTFGTPELLDRARAAGRHRLGLLLPPVDVHQNSPDAADGREFRATYGLDADDIVLVTVSRLVEFLKLEGLRRTVQAMAVLGRDMPLRFVIVGDGTARRDLEGLAAETNDALGRPAVVLTGALVDPRPAYAAADVVVGMGGSSLRALAFAKPTVVVGEQGFGSAFTPETADYFRYAGMYGLGDGDVGNAGLVAELRRIVSRPERFPALGEFSRDFIVRHYSLESVARQLDELCREAVAGRSPVRVRAADGVRTAAIRVAGSALPRELRRQVTRFAARG
ncbi:glycosyltransferase family 4 protein [Micromonospora sp. NPDC006766]|uniref:glycosyltransferase family 4 protein n=1 Tax=Micromonospora sp. NPDC006766 TaxID=3154778 RepID=UPI0033E95821